MPPPLPEEQRFPAVFWGILDLKYDGRTAFHSKSGHPSGSKPVLERVRVLETGDGRISKFSGDGAAIQELMKARYTSKDASAFRR